MNKEFTEEIVDDLANDLLIGLTRDENKMVLDEMSIIDETVSMVEKVPNISNIEPMTHCLDDFEFRLREDEVEESVPLRDLQANCDDTEGRETQVPKVVG